MKENELGKVVSWKARGPMRELRTKVTNTVCMRDPGGLGLSKWLLWAMLASLIWHSEG